MREVLRLTSGAGNTLEQHPVASSGFHYKNGVSIASMKTDREPSRWKLVSLTIGVFLVLGLLLYAGAHHPPVLW